MNNVMLIGKYYSINEVSDDLYILTLVITNDDGNLTLPVKINKALADRIKEFCNEGDLFGVKGFISVDNNEL